MAKRYDFSGWASRMDSVLEEVIVLIAKDERRHMKIRFNRVS